MKKSIGLLLLLFFAINASAQERYVTIDGQKFRIKQFGAGDVTVVFEAGMSDSIETWRSIPDSISSYARVFMYDRAGIGKSDTTNVARTVPNYVKELRAILHRENINPPYVLVGHSLGGFITRYFVDQYPDEVKGLLLLDPAAERWWDGMSKKELRDYKTGGDKVYSARPKSYQMEWEQLLPNIEYMRSIDYPESMPIILVSATAWKWYKYHKKIIKGHKNSKHVELEGTHNIHQDQPDAIIQYIKELIQQ